MGIVSHVLVTNMRRPLLCSQCMLFTPSACSGPQLHGLGPPHVCQWHEPGFVDTFSFPTLTITIPATIVILIWLGSLYGAKLRMNSAALSRSAFISMFVSGGVSGFFSLQPSIDIMLHATYFVVWTLPMVWRSSTFGIFAGTHSGFPKCTTNKARN